MAVQMLEDGTFEPVAHAVAGRRYLPLAVDKQFFGVVGEFVVLRPPDHADRRVGAAGSSIRRSAAPLAACVCNSSPACSGRG